MLDFKKELETMRAKYAKKPLKGITLPLPRWLKSDDALCSVFRDKDRLVSEGKIYYAHIVQANNLLFRKDNSYDCPAMIIYSPDDVMADKPFMLGALAHQLFSYKDKDPETVPEEWREIARVITDEFDRSTFEFDASAGGISAHMSMPGIIVFREHLPKKVLLGSILPILALPGESDAVLILPEKYWSKAFRKEWIKGRI